MAFKTDFTKLNRPRSAEEIEEYQRERADARVADAAQRKERSTKTISMTLVEVSPRNTMAGDREMPLWGSDAHGRRTRASFLLPDCYDREVSDAVLQKLIVDASYTMQGYRKSYTNREGKKFFTFQAQAIDGIELPQLGGASGAMYAKRDFTYIELHSALMYIES